MWCCAGSAHPTLFLDTPAEKLGEQMSTNYFSAAYTAHAVLRAWLAPSQANATPGQAPRQLVFTSSFIALYTFVGYAPYAPAKAALRSLADTLSMEVALYAGTHAPVAVHTLFPATILTAGYEAENRVKSDLTKMLEEDDGGQTADRAAEESIKGLEKGDEMIATTWLTRMVMCGVLGGTRRNGWAVVDTGLSWVMSLVMPYVRYDHEKKVRRWAEKHGPSGMKQQ